MTFSPKFMVSALLLTTLGVVGAPTLAEEDSSAAQVKKDTRELIDSLGSYTAEQRDQALEKAKEALARLDKRIQDLEARVRDNWENMDQETRQQAREHLEALRERRMKLAEWYGGMKTGASQAWEDIKRGFTDAYEAFGQAWEESEEDLDSEQE